MVIHGRRTKQKLTRTLALKTRRRLNVYEIHSRGNSFSPEMSRNKRRNHKSTSCFNYMAMLALSNTILDMSTRIRQLGESTFTVKKLTKSYRYVFPLS
jgi:hypothetical protein